MTRNESGKTKKSRKFQNEDDQPEKLTKEETQVARFLRLKCPNKQANLNGIKVDFFIGSKLVDCLMESKFGPGTLEDPSKTAPYDENAKRPLMESRHACFKYMQQLMYKGLFARANKIYKEQPVGEGDETPNLRKRKVKEVKEDLTNPESTPSKSSPKPGEKKPEPKKKFKLEIHDTQRFIDEPEPYIWYYETTSTMSSIIGGLLILGSIAICCFPLWPSIVREGVYYVSLAGCGFLGSVVALAVVKYIIFAFLWILTLGTLELWIFPNLTEDVGFFESFLPMYRIKMHTKQQQQLTPTINSESDTKTIETEITPETVTEEANVVDKKNLTATTHRMHDLTESTVEISSEPTASNDDDEVRLEKVQEDYDFELVDELEEQMPEMEECSN